MPKSLLLGLRSGVGLGARVPDAADMDNKQGPFRVLMIIAIILIILIICSMIIIVTMIIFVIIMV